MTTSDQKTFSYKKILVPHDGTSMSDKSLIHAISLSILSKGSIVILNVIDEDNIPPSALLAFMNKEKEKGDAGENLRNFVESASKKFLEDKVKLCNQYGIQNAEPLVKVGKPVNEIITTAREVNTDLIIMASSKISSSVRALGSTVRKVLDNINIPVLVIHE